MKKIQDIWDRAEERRKKGKEYARITEREISANLHRMQASYYLRNMIKALEIHPWQNTIADWQRYYEAKNILKMRRRKKQK